MPKVTRKDDKEQAALQPVPTAMDTDDGSPPSTSALGVQQPHKFPPLTALDPSGRKVDFRRVSSKLEAVWYVWVDAGHK